MSIVSVWVEIRGDNLQANEAIDNYGKRDF